MARRAGRHQSARNGVAHSKLDWMRGGTHALAVRAGIFTSDPGYRGYARQCAGWSWRWPTGSRRRPPDLARIQPPGIQSRWKDRLERRVRPARMEQRKEKRLARPQRTARPVRALTPRSFPADCGREAAARSLMKPCASEASPHGQFRI